MNLNEDVIRTLIFFFSGVGVGWFLRELFENIQPKWNRIYRKLRG